VANQLVAELSHGQQRQLESAWPGRAPRLICSTSGGGLSPVERRELMSLLRSLPSHTGFVLIEHDLDIALAVVDYVTVMHNARILKHGTPKQIEVDPEVQAIYLGDRHG
jgi:branched-chain amino acid transport system ATP-binding protein